MMITKMRKYSPLVLLMLFVVSMGAWVASAFVECYCEKIENCEIHYHCCGNGHSCDGSDACAHGHDDGMGCECCHTIPMQDLSALVDKMHKSIVPEKTSFGLDCFIVLSVLTIEGFEPCVEDDNLHHPRQEYLDDQYITSPKSLRAPPVLS